MRSISDTIARLQGAAATTMMGGMAVAGAAGAGLDELTGFGDDPGKLRALMHVPRDLAPGSALVVVLHGCTQSAAAYDRGSGWSELADRHGFAMLFAEQTRANNANLCFNWFVPEDVAVRGGEAQSIRAMTEAAIARHRLDPARVYVTGLSAGGAMASAMLATAPDLFAGGAIIAGLPYGMVSGVPQAFDRMRGHGYDVATLQAALKRALAGAKRVPTVSVWQGLADTTVAPVNAATIVDQWRGVHDVVGAATVERIDGHEHRIWRDRGGRTVIEEYRIAGLAHGTPIATQGDEAVGIPGPHMLDAGISSTYRIAASWGLVPERATARPVAEAAKAEPAQSASAWANAFDPSKIIDDALRQAGLLKR